MVSPDNAHLPPVPVQDLAQALRVMARWEAEGSPVRFVSDPSLSSQTAPAVLESKGSREKESSCPGWLMRRRVLTLLGVSGSLPPYMLEEAVQDPDSGFGHFMQVLEHHLGRKLMLVVAERQGIGTETAMAAVQLRQLAGTDVWDALEPSRVGNTLSPAELFVARWQPGSHAAVRRLLRACFGTFVTLEERSPGMLAVPAGDQARLGRTARLSEHNLGRHVRNDMNRIGIRVACRSVAQFRRWMPGGEDWTRLECILAVGLGRCFDVRVRIALAESDTPGLRLGQCRLGQSAVAGRMTHARERIFESRMGLQGGNNEH